MKIYRPLVLDFSKKNYNNTVLASQFDTLSRYVDITLIDNSVPVDITNHTVRIYAKKPDGTRVFNDAEIIDATNGKVRVELTNQILAVTGLVECELTLYGTDGSIIASQKFYINVEKTLRDDSAIESTNEFTALTNALNDIEQAKADVGVVGSLNDELENNINTGTQLKTDLDVNIQTGTQLKADLETDITAATQKKTELENVIATADTTTYATKEEITTINSQLEDNTNKIGILSKSVIPIKTTSITNNFRPTDLNFRRKSSIRNYYNLKQVVASLDLSSNILLTDSNMYPTQNITTNGLTINQIDLDSRIGKRTIVNLSSNKSIPNATDTIITFDVASINEINAFNISAPTRLTVSERIKKVIIKANVRLQVNADGYRSLFIKKNGSKMVGLPAMTTSATPGGVTFVHISSGIIDVVEGDYFEIFVWQNSGVSLNLEANNETWASIEVIE